MVRLVNGTIRILKKSNYFINGFIISSLISNINIIIGTIL